MMADFQSSWFEHQGFPTQADACVCFFTHHWLQEQSKEKN